MSLDLRSATSSKAHGPLARLMGAAYAMVLVVSVYLCSVYIADGWMTYLLSVPACVVLIITALVRVNDMSIDMSSKAWNVRRAGLILVALYAVGQITVPVLVKDWPSWQSVIGLWGFALVWLTSPHQPPWGQYVWGKQR